jgi:hypothetical protein
MHLMISSNILVDKLRNLKKGTLNLIEDSPIVLFPNLPPEEDYAGIYSLLSLVTFSAERLQPVLDLPFSGMEQEMGAIDAFELSYPIALRRNCIPLISDYLFPGCSSIEGTLGCKVIAS